MGREGPGVRETSSASAAGRCRSRLPDRAHHSRPAASAPAMAGPNGRCCLPGMQTGVSDRPGHGHACGRTSDHGLRRHHGCGHVRRSLGLPPRHAKHPHGPRPWAWVTERDRRPGSWQPASSNAREGRRGKATQAREAGRAATASRASTWAGAGSFAAIGQIVMILSPSCCPTTITTVKWTFLAKL
jgi:hypothetical protein